MVVILVANDVKRIGGSINLKVPISGAIKTGGKNFRELDFRPISEFQPIGNAGILYIDTTNDKQYYWDGSMYRSFQADFEIVAHTANEWRALSNYRSKPASLYIYTDYRQEDGEYIPAIKIGDGNSYVNNLPFFDTGVTEGDREFWNNKVSAMIDPNNQKNLILYTDKR